MKMAHMYIRYWINLISYKFREGEGSREIRLTKVMIRTGHFAWCLLPLMTPMAVPSGGELPLGTLIFLLRSMSISHARKGCC